MENENRVPYTVDRYVTLEQLKDNLRNCMESCRILAKTIKELEEKKNK
jgi:hypothetical protein